MRVLCVSYIGKTVQENAGPGPTTINPSSIKRELNILIHRAFVNEVSRHHRYPHS